jgi:hypothetical protein
MVGRGLEDPELPVLDHVVPGEAAAIHGDVDAARQRLHERERAAEIEEAIRAAEGIGHHRAGEHDRLREPRLAQHACGVRHGVGAVGDHDPLLGGAPAVLQDQRISVRHLQAVEHHSALDRQPAAAERSISWMWVSAVEPS